MSNCFSKSELTDFCNLMKLPDGTPLLPIDMLDWLVNKGFFKAPASTKYHGAHEGGLYQHSSSVMKFLVHLTKDNDLHWQDERSPYIVGMFHDLCNIDQYVQKYQTEINPKLPPSTSSVDTAFPKTVCGYEYNPNTLLKGHGEKSVMLLSQFYRLTEEEIACIRYHMGAFTPKEEWNDYTGAIHTYPNVLWTHQADMLASHVAGI
ncbi:MAG: hypothetical protein ACI3XN_05725 [Eubacteriales bacterium]